MFRTTGIQSFSRTNARNSPARASSTRAVMTVPSPRCSVVRTSPRERSARDQVAAHVRDADREGRVRLRQCLFDRGPELVDALAGVGGDEDGVGPVGAQLEQAVGLDHVELVDDDEFGDLFGADLGEHFADRFGLAERVGVRAVDDVDDEIRFGDFFQRGPECLDELVREVADEPDGVGDGELAALGGARAPRRGVEGGEQRVLDEDARAGEGVEQARLAGVGVAGDGDARDAVAGARVAFGLAGHREFREFAAELGDPRADAAAVGLELGLAGAAQADAAVGAALAAHGVAPAAQARQQVLQLRELDLGLALAALGVLGEDVEDQGGAVDDLDVDRPSRGRSTGRGTVRRRR